MVLPIVSFKSVASNLGVIGPVYPISERDLIEVIHEKINQKIKSGELDKLHNDLRDKGKQYAKRPSGINLPRASEYRAVEINPVYTLDRDITDEKGKIIFKKGKTVNPLEVRSLTKTLCFINGDDPDQVLWAKQYCSWDVRNKLILIQGDYQVLTEKFKSNRLYFDQKGYLVNRLGIKAVPAVLRQSGMVLYVEEFPIDSQ